MQVGRAVLIAKGPEAGKLGVIGMSSSLFSKDSTNAAKVEIISEKSVSHSQAFYVIVF